MKRWNCAPRRAWIARCACLALMIAWALPLSAQALSEADSPVAFTASLARGTETILHLKRCDAVYYTVSAAREANVSIRRAYLDCAENGGESLIVIVSDASRDTGDPSADARFRQGVEALIAPMQQGETLTLEGYVDKVSLDGQSMDTGDLLESLSEGVDPDEAASHLLDARRALEALLSERAAVVCALDGSPLRAPAAGEDRDYLGMLITVALVAFALVGPFLLRRRLKPPAPVEAPAEAANEAVDGAQPPLPERLRRRE